MDASGFPEYQYEFQHRVLKQIEEWQVLRPEEVTLTAAAKQLLSQTIDRIVTDPSPRWIDGDTKENQERAIELIPAVLEEAYFQTMSAKPTGKVVLSSWEVLHSFSKRLDSFCFIKKKRLGRHKD